MVRVTLKEQEQTGTYKFDGQIVYTRGIEAEFGDLIFKVIADTYKLIHSLVKENKADYFQVAVAESKDGKRVKYYIIDDVDHVTFLLPCEYQV